MTRVFVGLGSNLQNPASQIRTALNAMSRLGASQLLAHSRLYRSVPLGNVPQPDYVNAVAALETDLRAMDFLATLQAIEQDQGRVRDGTRWGPRTLDLDILMYGDDRISETGLEVPHPGLHERNFVLYPLYEIAPGLDVPGRGALSTLVAQCPATGLEPIDAQ